MNKKMVFGVIAALVFLVGCGEQTKELNESGAQPNDGAVTYDCQGEDIKADFNNDVDPQTVDLFFTAKNTEITLPNVEAASGAKYSDNDITFWTHQEEANLSIESTGQSLNCVEVEDAAGDNAVTDANGNVVTPGCQAWFDGCNTCHVVEGSTELACTKMMCAPETIKPSRCMDEEAIENDKKDCSAAGGVWSDEQNSCFEDPSTMAGEEGDK